MRIAVCASEGAPYAKSGGLGDVMEALPAALKRIEGNEVVLFRQVTVAKDAEVEDCILMNDCVVGEGAELKYCILDKNVTVTPGAKLIGTKKNPIIVKRGETV